MNLCCSYQIVNLVSVQPTSGEGIFNFRSLNLDKIFWVKSQNLAEPQPFYVGFTPKVLNCLVQSKKPPYIYPKPTKVI